mmetsp:Transcript_71419/g.197236  ORF Transcript_71419/g.197236 Transcript_71419/m.197236 type:complete len:159 (-) Transcript_71419:119-595(-)
MFSFTTSGGLCEVTQTAGSMTHTKTDEAQDWLEKSIQVCKGDFSDPEDRHRLKGVISALWMYAVLSKDQDDTLFNAVERAKNDVFPPEFFPDKYIAIAEGVAANLKTTDWMEAFASVDRPSAEAPPVCADSSASYALDVEDGNIQATAAQKILRRENL